MAEHTGDERAHEAQMDQLQHKSVVPWWVAQPTPSSAVRSAPVVVAAPLTSVSLPAQHTQEQRQNNTEASMPYQTRFVPLQADLCGGLLPFPQAQSAPSSSTASAVTNSGKPDKRTRARMACKACRISKNKCDGERGITCSRCAARGADCTYPDHIRRKWRHYQTDAYTIGQGAPGRMDPPAFGSDNGGMADSTQCEGALQPAQKRQRVDAPQRTTTAAPVDSPYQEGHATTESSSPPAAEHATEPMGEGEAATETVVVKKEPRGIWIEIDAVYDDEAEFASMAEPPETSESHSGVTGSSDAAQPSQGPSPPPAELAEVGEARGNSRSDASSRSHSLASTHSSHDRAAPEPSHLPAVPSSFRGIHFPIFDRACLGPGKRWPADCELALARYVSWDPALRKWAAQWKLDGHWASLDTDPKLAASLQRFTDLTQGPTPELIHMKLLSCLDTYLHLISSLTPIARSSTIDTWTVAEDLQWLAKLETLDASPWLRIWHDMRVAAYVTATASRSSNGSVSTAVTAAEASKSTASPALAVPLVSSDAVRPPRANQSARSAPRVPAETPGATGALVTVAASAFGTPSPAASHSNSQAVPPAFTLRPLPLPPLLRTSPEPHRNAAAPSAGPTTCSLAERASTSVAASTSSSADLDQPDNISTGGHKHVDGVATASDTPTGSSDANSGDSSLFQQLASSSAQNVKLQKQVDIHERHIVLLHAQNQQQGRWIAEQAEMLCHQATEAEKTKQQLQEQAQTLNGLKLQLAYLCNEMRKRGQ